MLKLKTKIEILFIFILSISVLFSYSAIGLKSYGSVNKNDEEEITTDFEDEDFEEDILTEKKSYIKWMTFDVPDEALRKAMSADIKSYNTDKHINWIDVLALLGSKYGGSWGRYKASDMDDIVKKLNGGAKINELAAKAPNFSYYYRIYDAVLHNFLDVYKTPSKDNPDVLTDKYGLAVFSPIAAGYGYGHYEDFGSSRSFGFARRHLGNDLMGTVGTPIIAVESGVVESAGWNRYGGWRIGIRSFDRKRYYYYAHLRKGHPYVYNLKEGMIVKQGEVIGYLGMTGYSSKEDVNGMQKPHLHFGMQIIFDESQKESNNEIWIDVYNIVNLLENHRSSVKKDTLNNDYYGVIY